MADLEAAPAGTSGARSANGRVKLQQWRGKGMPTNVLEKPATHERSSDPPLIVAPRQRSRALHHSVRFATDQELSSLARPVIRRTWSWPSIPTRIPGLDRIGKAGMVLVMLAVLLNAVVQLVPELGPSPVFTPYEGQSTESISFVLTSGPERVAAVPGALLLNWQEGPESTLRMTLGNPNAVPVVERPVDGGAAAIRYPAAWPGVDAVVKATPYGLAYDLLVQPGADPSVIDLAYVGATGLTIDNGHLRTQTPDGNRLSGLPESWQDGPNGRENVDSAFVLRGDGHFGFSVGPFDPSRVLLIDPPDAPTNN
jgi:hypothetical protein